MKLENCKTSLYGPRGDGRLWMFDLNGMNSLKKGNHFEPIQEYYSVLNSLNSLFCFYMLFHQVKNQSCSKCQNGQENNIVFLQEQDLVLYSINT